MQNHKNVNYNSPYAYDAEDGRTLPGYAPNKRRFIMCLRCGKRIRNNLRTIKNHEYYCSHRRPEAEDEEYYFEQDTDDEQDNEPYEMQYPEQEPPVVREEGHFSISNVVKAALSVFGTVAFLLAVYKLLILFKTTASQGANSPKLPEKAPGGPTQQKLAPQQPYTLPHKF